MSGDAGLQMFVSPSHQFISDLEENWKRLVAGAVGSDSQ